MYAYLSRLRAHMSTSKDPKWNNYVNEAIEEELRKIELKDFENFRLSVLSSKDPAPKRLAQVDEFGNQHKTIDPEWLRIMKEEINKQSVASQGPVVAQRKELEDKRFITPTADAPDISLHRVDPSTVDRKPRLDIVGDGTPLHKGMDLDDFETYTRKQADWFVEPSISASDRADLWKMLLTIAEGPHIVDGTNDIPISALLPLSANEWKQLKAFCRAVHPGMPTVKIKTPTSFTLAERLSLGGTLVDLEALIPKEVLEITVTEIQLKEINASPSILFGLSLYWNLFQPHLQQTDVDSSSGADRNVEFQQVLDLLNRGFGILIYLPLLGRIRNLHRFTSETLDRLMVNFKDTSHTKPLQLVIHSAHDPSASFRGDQPLIETLVTNIDTLVLMLEGMASLADVTAEIPKIASTFGKPDGKGVNRIARVMISADGETREVGMAGTGVPTVAGGRVDYPEEKLDLDNNAKATTDLIDALLNNLDPANVAKIVFNGCLVGWPSVVHLLAPNLQTYRNILRQILT